MIDNHGIIEGITTPRGNFVGIGRSPSIRDSLINVAGTLKELEWSTGGWEFLISTSKNHASARELALRPSECNQRWASLMPLQGELKQIVPRIGSAYVDGAPAAVKRYEDGARLTVGSQTRENFRVSTVRDCGYWGNDSLAFAPMMVTFEGQKTIGETSALTILRKQAGQWALLAAAVDPVSTGASLADIPHLSQGFIQGGVSSEAPAPATLLSPDEGKFPQPSGGERFGDFIWQPSPSSNVIAEIVEFAYGDDARLFVRLRPDQNPREDRVSTGKLWSTGSVWKWRVWSIAATGQVSFSEARSFTH